MKWPSKPQQLEGLADAQGLEILGNLTGASGSGLADAVGLDIQTSTALPIVQIG